MSEIATQIEVRLNQLGVKIEKKDIEIRIEKLINEFKVPLEYIKVGNMMVEFSGLIKWQLRRQVALEA